MAGQTQGERIAGLEAWSESHDTDCERRYGELRDGMAAIKSDLKADVQALANDVLRQTGDIRGKLDGHNKAAWAIAIMVLSWMGAQLWQGVVVKSAPAASVAVAVERK